MKYYTHNLKEKEKYQFRKKEKIQGQLSPMSESDKGSEMKEIKRRQLKRSLEINTDIQEFKEKLKEPIQGKAQRIRLYEKRKRFVWQKKISKDVKNLYREVGKIK